MERRARDSDEVCKLYILMNMLKKFYKGRARSVLEVTLLEEFPIDAFLPVEKFSPRQIIESMTEKHRRTMQDIWENPNNLLVFTYTSNNIKENQIKFTNNMEFYADIYTICFYYHRILNYNFRNQSMLNIMRLLIDKYGINTELQAENLDPTTLTFHRIAYSFPSIMLEISRYDFYIYNFRLDASFSNQIKLPRAIFSPVISSIIPMLNDPPIAILIAIAIKSANVYPHINIPLATIYRRILMSYTSTVFPERLKLQLCRRWRIVTVYKNEYHFSPYLKLYRKRAKDAISNARPADPNLKNILSRI